MKFTDQELELINEHLTTFEKIYRNQSASNISIEFRGVLKQIANNHQLSYCDRCASSIYSVASRIYKQFIDYGKHEKSTRSKRTQAQKKTVD